MNKDAFLKKLNNSSTALSLVGISPKEWAMLLKRYFSDDIEFQQNIFIFASENDAETFYEYVKGHKKTLYFPDLGADPYSSMIPSEFNLVKRLSLVSSILEQKESFNIVTTLNAALLWLPPVSFFESEKFTINISDIIAPQELAKKLISLGLKKVPSTEEPGTFSMKGEIFDIYPIDHEPVRLHYFDDMIEEIFEIDKDTLITKRDTPLESVQIGKTQFSFLRQELVNNFRTNLPRPSLSEKDKFKYRESITKKLSNGEFFDDYPLFIKYFFDDCYCLLDYATRFQIHCFDQINLIQEYDYLKDELKVSYEEWSKSNDIIKPAHEDLYNISYNISEKTNLWINEVNVSSNLEDDFHNTISIDKIPTYELVKSYSLKSPNNSKKQNVCLVIEEYLNKNYNVCIFYESESSKNEILYSLNLFIDNPTAIARIEWDNDQFTGGFLYQSEKTLFISESDFYERKLRKSKRSKKDLNSDLFADQLSTLTIGDFILHKDHGIGKYLGVENLNMGGSTSDFIVIEYKDSDKVYVPVYKLNLVQKYATSETLVTLANLKTKKFDQAKAKARTAVKKLAFDLLELQAKRKLQKGFQFSEPDHTFNDFSLSFKFKETPDQLDAIESVIDDMTSEKPMDRLVCGDVGFGKTEVAMRAAFKAVLDNKQVGLLVPTTVLTFQHYNNFVERFKDFPVNIEYISRFKTKKQVDDILLRLSEGKVDILIGTHKLLSSQVKFKDLGLLVIDEEQRFGVAHKEKLKLLKENVDTLTLTATPIPRTLQMSFLGIKDLSLIKTAPPRRQTIKTYIIKEDVHTLKLALEKELSRGGQVFVVHNKVHDIEQYTASINKLVPHARVIYAHGQLPERELEKRITDFYNYKFDILVSTTIIESGIDIPRANTMIIDRADTYGLSQLHQLRGRIGRSDKKAYAYFIIPEFQKLSEIATKRLKALQTYADLGSGFSLATSDLEIRGSGDILGPEQSGHIGSIGLELYMELLEESIRELKGQDHITRKNISISSPFDSYIPSTYIENAGIRLKFYKRISNAQSEDTLKSIEFELTDQFGRLPQEVQNLIYIIKARIYLSELAISDIKIKSLTITLQFDANLLDQNSILKEKIINLLMQRPKIYKINPDYSIICHFKDKINLISFLEFAQYLNKELKE